MNNREKTGRIGNCKPPEHSKFKKGQSGNPKGRPKKIPEIEEMLADVLGKVTNGRTAAKGILTALLKKASKGDIRAAELLLDRAYGKPKTHVQATVNADFNLSDLPIIFK